MHKDDEEIRIYSKDIEHYKSLGYDVGISDKHRQSMSIKRQGVQPWNKGLTKETDERMLLVSNTLKVKSSFVGKDPWNKGLTDVLVSWNKGLTKETDERILKSSIKLSETWSTQTERKQAFGQMSHSRKGIKKTEEQLELFLQKQDETKRKNNSYNTSTNEETMYKSLCESYGKHNVKRNYRDKELYPYRCDFYIKSENLFIELNLHWTHGGKPYDPNDKECQEQLKLWQEKAKTSKFYENAIETWTVRDVKKLETAKKNKLNYKVVYDVEK